MNLKVKALIFLTAVLAIGGVFSVRQIIIDRQQIKLLQKTPEQVAKEEAQSLVAKLSQLVVLPQGEDPTVATVNDKEKLKDQPVFANAQNGDKVLIYVGAKKAYIYSPSKNKLIDVVAVNIQSSTPAITGVSAENPLKVALYNGTPNQGITNTLEQRIKTANIVGVAVVSKETAKKTDYSRTEVIDLTGKFTDQAKQLANLLNGEVVNLPAGEIAPKADVLVIIGGDFK